MVTIRCETGDDVDVDGSTLAGALLRGAKLHRAILEQEDLGRANLEDADLRSARLDGAIFDDANLARARMPACSANGASFVRANLGEAFMRSAGFSGANFTGASLRGANVGRARLDGAILHGADLRAVDLAEASLRDAMSDEATVWPDGFDPEAHGVRRSGGSNTYMTDAELDRAETLCNAATQGPWQSFVEGRDHEAGSSFIRTAGPDIELSGASRDDQDFIASARQDVGRLVAEVRRLRAALSAAGRG